MKMRQDSLLPHCPGEIVRIQPFLAHLHQQRPTWAVSSDPVTRAVTLDK